MGPEDHIQVDLSDPADTLRAIGEMRERLEAQQSRLDALVNNAGISPKGEGGARLGGIETPLEDWQHVFQVNFFAPIMLARGLIAELERPRAPSSTSPRSPAAASIRSPAPPTAPPRRRWPA